MKIGHMVRKSGRERKSIGEMAAKGEIFLSSHLYIDAGSSLISLFSNGNYNESLIG